MADQIGSGSFGTQLERAVLSGSLAIILLAASVRSGDDAGGDEFSTVVYSGMLEALRSNGEIIGAVGFIVLSISYLRKPYLNRDWWSAPFTLFFLSQAVIAVRAIVGLQPNFKWLAALPMSLVLAFVVQGALSHKHRRSGEGAILWGIAIWAALFTIINIYLFIEHYQTSSWRGRFLGISNHPNFLGVAEAYAGAIALTWLRCVQAGQRRHYIIAPSALFLGAAFMVIESGSRTGAVSLIGSTLAYFYSGGMRSAKTMLFMAVPIICAFVFFSGELIGVVGQLNGGERLLSAGDTRSNVWEVMLNAFLSSPIIGVGTDLSGTAGSYLRVLGFGGIVAGGPMLAAIVGATIFEVNKVRISSSDFRILPILSVTVIAGIFEGFLLESFGLGVMLTVVCMSAASVLRRPAKRFALSARGDGVAANGLLKAR